MDSQDTTSFSKVLEVIAKILKKPEWNLKIENKEITQKYSIEYLRTRDANAAIFEEALELLRQLPEQAHNLAPKYESPVRRNQAPLPALLFEQIKEQLKCKKPQGQDMLIPTEPLDENREHSDLEWLVEEAATKPDFWDEDCEENWKLGLECLECGKIVDGKHLYFKRHKDSFKADYEDEVFCKECANLQSTPPCIKLCGSKYMIRQVQNELERRNRNNQVLIEKHQVQGEDDFLSKELYDLFVKEMDYLAEISKHDFHPGTKGKVMNLIHPSMYPYIIGQSELMKGIDLPNPTPKQRDGRTSTYQWLPAEVSVEEDGMCQFTSYINNLYPDIYPNLYSLLGLILSHFLPLFERCLNQSLRGRNLQVVVKASDYILEPGQSYSGNWHLEGTQQEHIVASGIYYYDITEGIIDEGLAFRRQRDEALDWPSHSSVPFDFESEIYEKCIARYVQKNEGTQDSWEVYLGDLASYLEDIRKELYEEIEYSIGVVPVGHIDPRPGRCVVFANTLQHKLTGIHVPENVQGTQRRRILCFFLVDPDRPIISSKAVCPQQQRCSIDEIIPVLQSVEIRGHALPVEVCEDIYKLARTGMSLKKALEHRLHFMYDRRLSSRDLSSDYEEEFALCEH